MPVTHRGYQGEGRRREKGGRRGGEKVHVLTSEVP